MPYATETTLSDNGVDLSTKELIETLHSPQLSKEARENAIELIYRRYSPEILRLIQAHIKVYEDVWDIHSEVWKVAYEGLRRFTWQADTKAVDPLKSWLLTTTHHKLQEFWRQHTSDPLALIEAQLSYFDTYDTFDAFAGESPTLQPQSLQERMDWLLTEAVRSLGPLEEKVILLTYYNGKNSREIGEFLKITPENVRICRHRAIKKLRDFFAQRSQAHSVEVYTTEGASHADTRR